MLKICLTILLFAVNCHSAFAAKIASNRLGLRTNNISVLTPADGDTVTLTLVNRFRIESDGSNLPFVAIMGAQGSIAEVYFSDLVGDSDVANNQALVNFVSELNSSRIKAIRVRGIDYRGLCIELERTQPDGTKDTINITGRTLNKIPQEYLNPQKSDECDLN